MNHSNRKIINNSVSHLESSGGIFVGFHSLYNVVEQSEVSGVKYESTFDDFWWIHFSCTATGNVTVQENLDGLHTQLKVDTNILTVPKRLQQFIMI